MKIVSKIFDQLRSNITDRNIRYCLRVLIGKERGDSFATWDTVVSNILILKNYEYQDFICWIKTTNETESLLLINKISERELLSVNFHIENYNQSLGISKNTLLDQAVKLRAINVFSRARLNHIFASK